METLINVDELITISDYDTVADEFKKNDIVLIKLNYLLKQYQQTNIIDTYNWNNESDNKKDDEFDTIEYVVRNEYDVFDSICITGKKLYNKIKKGKKGESFDKLIHDSFTNTDMSEFFKKTFNEYVQRHGYPYLIDNNILHPPYDEFILECIMVYLINEVRKWNFNIKQQIKDKWTIEVDNNFINLYNMVKPELIAITLETQDKEILDKFDKLNIIEMLEYGPADHKTNKPIKNYNDSFFIILQRTLMLYITNRINGKYKEQYILTKQKPIFNEGSEQHRVYRVANSLMGIAYDKLLFSLTATEFSCERIICEIPNCINEFEKEGKYRRCPRHRYSEDNDDEEGKREAKAFDNMRDYYSKKTASSTQL